MRLLFFGDMARTGFGTVTTDLGRELMALGHDLRFVSQNEIGDLPEPFGSRTWKINDPSAFLPELALEHVGTKGLGLTALALRSDGYAGFFNGKFWPDGWVPEMALVLGDPGNVRIMVMRDETTRAAFSMVPTFHYVPIEGVDLPPTYREMWSLMQPIAMTNFGAEQIERIMGVRPPMVYHGIDTETFRPVSAARMLVVTAPDKAGIPVIHKLRSKADCKRLIANSDHGRWLLRTDRNVPRKRYPELFRAMAPVLAERPDTALVIHCLDKDMGGSLEDSLSKYPPRLRAQFIVTDAGGSLGREWLVALYNAADVYVSNSAEGFGLTIAESLACGTPAVGLDYSSVPEVIGPGGVLSPIASLVDNEYGYFWAAANQKAFGEATGALLDDELRRKQLGRAGVEHVRTSFSWARAARQFTDILSPLEAVA